jgi:XRE family transcriptional regulator, fatty acid utilization regulator
MAETQTLDPLVFGRRLRHLRRSAGLTLDDLGERVAKPGPYLSLVENGKKEPRLNLVVALADALGVPLTDLLDNEPPTRRDALEIELVRAQESSVFAGLDLPTIKAGARMDNETLNHLVGLHRELRRRSGLDTAGSEEVRRANGDLHNHLEENRGYLPGIEQTAAEALAAVGHSGTGPFTSRNLMDLVDHTGFELMPIEDMPGFARSIVDNDRRRIYIAQRNELRTRQARKAVLQTLAAFLLDHEPEPDLPTFLRQRMETAYFATAVLAPEAQTVAHLTEARQQHDMDVEDVKELFYVSYEMAAWRMANLLPHHFDIDCHLVVSSEVGTVVKGMVNDGAPVPRDEHGGIETQRLCRRWGSRVTFASEDRFGTHRQYTDTPSGTYFCTTHIEEGREPPYAVTLGVRFADARWFRGRESDHRETSTCPDPSCCRVPAPELASRFGDSIVVSARSQARILGLMAPDPYPEMDLPEVLTVVDRHTPNGGRVARA